MNFLQHLNWIDVVVVLVLIRFIYISIQTGFVVEFLKILGVFLTLFVCFHYYNVLGSVLFKHSAIPAEIGAGIAFLVLWLVMIALCMLIRNGLTMLFTIQAHAVLDKWGAGVVAVARTLVVSSMLLFLLVVSGVPYLEASVSRSLAHRYVLHVAPNMYRASCDGFVTKLFPSEKFNIDVSAKLDKIPKR